MRWIFVCVRNNCVEKIRGFADYAIGSNFTDSFIRSINPTIEKTPIYYEGEFYKDEDVTVGLYDGFDS